MRERRWDGRGLMLGIALLFTMPAGAFDWPAQTNNELQDDMIVFAQQFAQEAHGTRAGRMMRRWVKAEKRRMAKDSLCWMADTHRQVARLKRIYKPCLDSDTRNADIRRLTLQLLDYPLHVNNTDSSTPEAVCKAYEASRDKYLADARAAALKQKDKKAPREDELEVTKVYNMGYMLRTAFHTLLIDIRWDGTPDEAFHLAKGTDMLLLTHPHVDHYSKSMLQAASAAGCTLVLPSEVMPKSDTWQPHVMWGGDYADKGIHVTAFPGNQGENIPNNVYVLEVDGWRIIDQGDNYDREQEVRVKEFPVADLIIAASWNKIQNILAAAMEAPDSDTKMPLFIPSHENEVTQHGIRNRESYHELFAREDRLGNSAFHYPPYMLMDIGETIVMKK